MNQRPTVLENAFLNEQVLLQKTLAETLLQSIPPGVVAIDEKGQKVAIAPRS